MMIALWPDHDVDNRRAADDLRALGLGHTACDRDAHIAPLARSFILGNPQPSELGVDFFGSLLADVAGAEAHQVGLLGTGCLLKDYTRQHGPHVLVILDVHLEDI